MKNFGLFCVALGLLAIPSVALAIGVNAGGSPSDPFIALPSVSDWAGGTIAGASGGATDTTTLDAAVQGIAQSAASTVLATDASATVTQLAAPRWNSVNQNLESNTTGTIAGLLKATLTNTSPNFITGFNLTYDYGLSGTGTEEITGLRAYYSGTGAAGSWTPIGTFGTAGPVTLSLSGLGTSFGTNPFYILWADDNGATSGAAVENNHTLDNAAISGVTLGGLLAPPVPVFGNVTPPQLQNFEGGGLPLNNGAQGTVTPLLGSNALQVNGTGLNATTDQVDLRGIAASSTKVVSVDLKAWETSQTSDFEAGDHVTVTAEWNADGLTTFTTATLVDVAGAPALTPFDPLVPNPADAVRATFGPTEAQNNATQAFRHFEVVLPSNAQTVRVHVNLATDSATEFMAVDNISVIVRPVPEPASVAMIGLGMIGLVGYGIRRRRSA